MRIIRHEINLQSYKDYLNEFFKVVNRWGRSSLARINRMVKFDHRRFGLIGVSLCYMGYIGVSFITSILGFNFYCLNLIRVSKLSCEFWLSLIFKTSLFFVTSLIFLALLSLTMTLILQILANWSFVTFRIFIWRVEFSWANSTLEAIGVVGTWTGGLSTNEW